MYFQRDVQAALDEVESKQLRNVNWSVDNNSFLSDEDIR